MKHENNITYILMRYSNPIRVEFIKKGYVFFCGFCLL